MPWLADYVLQKPSVMKYCHLPCERCSGSVHWSVCICSDSWLSSGVRGQDAEGQARRRVSVGGLTPAFSSVLLRISGSLLFFLIKPDNIWRARADHFNVANVTAGVILVVFYRHEQHFHLGHIQGSRKNIVIQSFKQPS